MRTPELTTAHEIERWCVEHIATLLGEPVEKIDPHADFDRLGIDSAMAVSLLLDLEEQLGDVPIPPEILFEYGTLAEVAVHLAGEVARRAPAPGVELAR
jgi:acyl carrier protein